MPTSLKQGDSGGLTASKQSNNSKHGVRLVCLKVNHVSFTLWRLYHTACLILSFPDT